MIPAWGRSWLSGIVMAPTAKDDRDCSQSWPVDALSYASAGGRVSPFWCARISNFWRFETPSLSKMLVR